MSASFPCPQCSSENVISSKKRGADFCEDCGYTFPPHEPTEEVVVPLRIFLSYGHDKNEKLVRRIKADLERRGHVVWFDRTPEAGKGISSGDDWRRSITEGIKDSGCVVSFLSEHSVRDPGVCRDEIAIAIGVKGGNVKTILVEGKDLEGEGKDLEIPVSVSHIQYHDMHLWDHGTDDVGIVSAGKDGAAEGDAKWESWYKENWDKIRKVVESKESQQFAGEIQELKGHLNPITCAARVCALVEKGFDGRHWLLERVEKWRTGNTDKSRLLWITGKPGFGKSAFAAHLVHNQPRVVIAAHFVEWNKRDHRDARNVIRSLAFQLATRLPDYRTLLLDLPEIATLDAKDSDELFDYLIANNLRHAIKGGRERYLVVIDGLDEAGISGRNELVNVLAREAKHLPEWISFVVTSRPESHVTAPLQGLIPQRMDTETKENLDDLKLYLNRTLDKQLAARPDRDQLVKDILDKSEGVFLYAEHFCEAVIAGHLSLDQRERFPQGLGGIYYQWFERQFPEGYDEIRPVLGAILAARDPIPVEIIEGRFQWTETQLQKELRKFGSLFLVTEENGKLTIKPYHKSLADWLTDPDKAGDFLISLKEGHATLAKFGLTEFKNGVSPDGYFIRHLIPHLVTANQLNEAAELLLDLPWLETKVAAGFAFEVPTDFDHVLKGYGSLEKGVETPLRLIGEAIRLDIHFIANSIDYPQALMQSVTDYLRPVTTPSPDDSQAVGFPQDVTAQLQELTAKWEEYTTKKGRSWIKRICIDRERVIAGPLQWQAEDQCLQDNSWSEQHSLVFSPNGEAVAIAAGWHSKNRPNAPQDWTKAYAITVWSTTTGRLLSRLFPDPSKVDLSDPPQNIPRPPQVERLFQDYFAFKTTGGNYERGYRREKSELVRRKAPLVRAPSLKAVLEASKKAIKKEEAPERYVGEDWREALVAGDVGALCWLDERTLLAGCRGGSIFIFDVDTTAQSGIVFGTNVDRDFKLQPWDNVKIHCLEKIGTDRVAVGTSFGTIELIEFAEPTSRSVCYVVKPEEPYRMPVRSLAWHDESGLLAIGTDVGTIHIVSPREDWSCIYQLSGHTDAATGLAWSPSGARLASVSWDRTLRMWDIGTQKEIWRSPEHDSGSLSLSWELAEDEVLTTWN
ncbi:MAG: TIR domain-containing protein, partial [Blastocatellia bacterium]|nr:TIR domain-containing protein [Blastocatellia bacterium]